MFHPECDFPSLVNLVVVFAPLCRSLRSDSRIFQRIPGGEIARSDSTHEMTTAQESESSSHFDRNVRSIVLGVEYATAFGHVSQ
jgi:hypothetical protein